MTNKFKETALKFHSKKPQGKLAIALTKPLLTDKDLSLAYSPGVGYPCLEIEKNPDLAYDYTAKGNFVAVISNGTAVLGLGDIGSLASKPVMEGKSALMKRFADVDSIDVLVKTQDCNKFIDTVEEIGHTWGGINLEDIKAPECFTIEKELQHKLDVPVFHDDQHGTAIITLAGIINATSIVNKKIEEMTFVINGAGAAGISCRNLLTSYGARARNIIMCDTRGVIYEDRKEGMNQWKKTCAVKTEKRTLLDAFQNVDVAIGLSKKNTFTEEMLKSMNKDPIVFAMANPDPEILPEDAKRIRPDVIIATGRSDYPNQINNVMCFPYLFRGALDVRAKCINHEMQIAAAIAIAELAKQPIPISVKNAYPDRKLSFGREYIIPTPFDPRLIYNVSMKVAKVAIETKVSRKQIADWNEYKEKLISISKKFNTSILHDNISDKKNYELIFTEGEIDNNIESAKRWIELNQQNVYLLGNKKELQNKLKNYDNEKLHIVESHDKDRLQTGISLQMKNKNSKLMITSAASDYAEKMKILDGLNIDHYTALFPIIYNSKVILLASSSKNTEKYLEKTIKDVEKACISLNLLPKLAIVKSNKTWNNNAENILHKLKTRDINCAIKHSIADALTDNFETNTIITEDLNIALNISHFNNAISNKDHLIMLYGTGHKIQIISDKCSMENILHIANLDD